jgi:hypothetical protein
VSFYRDRDGREVDFLVELRDGVVPIEVKTGLPGRLPRLSTIREPSWTGGWVVSLAQRPREIAAATSEWTLVSPSDLVERVLKLS